MDSPKNDVERGYDVKRLIWRALLWQNNAIMATPKTMNSRPRRLLSHFSKGFGFHETIFLKLVLTPDRRAVIGSLSSSVCQSSQFFFSMLEPEIEPIKYETSCSTSPKWGAFRFSDWFLQSWRWMTGSVGAKRNCSRPRCSNRWLSLLCWGWAVQKSSVNDNFLASRTNKEG